MESPPNFSSAQTGQSQGHHSLSGNACGRDNTYIRTFIGRFHRLTGGEIHRLQWTAQGGNRFQISAHANVFPIGDATFDSAGIVPAASKARERGRSSITYFIMHGGARGSRSGDSGTNLYCLDRLQRHDGRGQARVEALIPLRVSAQTRRDVVRDHFENTADRISSL